MIANHIHHALAQVQDLQQKILEKQRFKGYSGRARAISGTVALLASVFFSLPLFPQKLTVHLLGWAAVLVFSLLLNFGAIIYWFLFDPKVKRDVRRLKPLIDVFPPFFVAGGLTVACLRSGMYDYLFGVWMTLFGLANLASRHVVPKKIVWVGFFYIAAGLLLLLFPGISFLNPLPFGIVFFIGEWTGGIILHFDGTQGAFRDFFRFRENYHAKTR